MLSATTVDTPAGPLSAICDDDGLCGMGFTADPEMLCQRLSNPRPMRSFADLPEITSAVQAYLAGDLIALDKLPVSPAGNETRPFLSKAWQALREVPAGQTITYAELATRAGSPAAVRAAATACAQNLVAPVVPCHRVIRSDGGLGGYYWGLPAKRWLLDHEAHWA